MQIKVNNISKEYDKKLPSYVKVLDGVSTSIKEGEAISIIGPTGSGKTTFIEHLNGLIIQDTGDITFLEVPYFSKLKLSKKPKFHKNFSEVEIKEHEKQYKQ
ncbi:ABC transporter of peptides [Chlamydia abortus]|nr:ABC transporter of peptides [Chlamydia abortus]SGA32353.1 ABC transporter of peptides [Chlamydia abortus]